MWYWQSHVGVPMLAVPNSHWGDQGTLVLACFYSFYLVNTGNKHRDLKVKLNMRKPACFDCGCNTSARLMWRATHTATRSNNGGRFISHQSQTIIPTTICSFVPFKDFRFGLLFESSGNDALRHFALCQPISTALVDKVPLTFHRQRSCTAVISATLERNA